MRWQVEWLFRLGKSSGQLDQSAADKPYRLRCERLAKLLGLVVQHGLLLTGGPLLPQSQERAATRVRAVAEGVAAALAAVAGVVVLVELPRRWHQVLGKPRRRGQPAAFQLAENPLELEYLYMPAA